MQWQTLKTRLSNTSTQQGMALFVAANLAYVIDYFFSFATGRLLDPAQFSIFVSLAGLSNVMTVGSRVIQTVVARYVVRFEADRGGNEPLAAFFQKVWRSAWLWGTAVMLGLIVLSWPIAAWLQIDDVRVVIALASTAVLLIVRPVLGGGLQGLQQFAPLGVVQIVQAGFRLVVGVALILLGWGVLGAMVALPLGSLMALLYGLSALDRRVWQKTTVSHGVTIPELFRYSAYTAVGLLSYAVLVNMDAVLVRRFFDADVAGNYGAAITLGKIVQFMPTAIVMLLFPKAARRQAAKQDPANVLLPAFGAVFVLCAAVVTIYIAFTDQIVRLTVGTQYEVDSVVLGLLGVGLMLLALVNVWLFYFLSIDQTDYILFMGVGIVLQTVLMFLFHDVLWQLPGAIVVNGLFLCTVGLVLFLRERRRAV